MHANPGMTQAAQPLTLDEETVNIHRSETNELIDHLRRMLDGTNQAISHHDAALETLHIRRHVLIAGLATLDDGPAPPTEGGLAALRGTPFETGVRGGMTTVG